VPARWLVDRYLSVTVECCEQSVVQTFKARHRSSDVIVEKKNYGAKQASDSCYGEMCCACAEVIDSSSSEDDHGSSLRFELTRRSFTEVEFWCNV
jgi:hypothetical protein